MCVLEQRETEKQFVSEDYPNESIHLHIQSC